MKKLPVFITILMCLIGILPNSCSNFSVFWRSRSSMPTTKDNFAFAAIGGELYTFGGGSSETGRISELKEHDPEANVRIWDTLSPFLNQIDLRDKTDWKTVPAGTGRKYHSKGDIVLENKHLSAVFSAKAGKVVVFSESGVKRLELIPLQLKGKVASITSCKVFWNTDDEATVEVHFSAKGMEKDFPVVFSFSDRQIIEVKPAENIKGISLISPIQFAIVPSFISDDLIFSTKDYSSVKTLYIPSENLLLGLLEGEDCMLVITWPKGEQYIGLTLRNEGEKGYLFESVDLESDGESMYLAILDAPGIWHKEELKSSYLERDVAIDWKRPFPAKWITQLYEGGVKTTYPLKEWSEIRVLESGGFWRAGIGYIVYPVWFDGENAFYHLSKKIPPIGESLIYFLERKGTPASVSTPVDIMRQTLDSQTYRSIIDSEGRKNRRLTRPNCTIGMDTCEVTNAIKPIFEAGEEVEKKEFIKGGTEDMVYFLARERERALEYQDFAHEMIEFLALTKKDKPELRPFLDKLENISREIIVAYEREKENMKDMEYTEKLAEETQALAHQKNPGNLVAFMELKRKWTGMGNAADDLSRELHTITRKLFQEAGYKAATHREAIRIAEEIRNRTQKCLRNPGSYEIWSDY